MVNSCWSPVVNWWWFCKTTKPCDFAIIFYSWWRNNARGS